LLPKILFNKIAYIVEVIHLLQPANHQAELSKGRYIMRLDVARKIRRKTQLTLGVEAGIHASKISLIENGYINPSEEEKLLIAEALGLKVADISWEPEALSA
jgi:DNA-binding XRE family transcriptional regulator